MSSSFPPVSAREAVRVFRSAGFEVLPDRGVGSHIVMHKAGWSAILTVPNHKELKRGTLRRLIRDAGMSVDEFVARLRA
jgi:predicted RNA binding protein YcfA (HicA-like mRNA interferase family)